MSELYQNTLRVGTARLSSWDYGNPGMYFVTICTDNKVCYFGDVTIDAMQLSPLGEIAHAEWLKTPLLRPDMNLELGEFVIMPNHVHGIIAINSNEYNSENDRKFRIHIPGDTPVNSFKPQSKNLASIVRGYKSAVTTFARKNGIPFRWQPRYHDRVIRSMDEYVRISDYIKNNPSNWMADEFRI